MLFRDFGLQICHRCLRLDSIEYEWQLESKLESTDWILYEVIYNPGTSIFLACISMDALTCVL